MLPNSGYYHRWSYLMIGLSAFVAAGCGGTGFGVSSLSSTTPAASPSVLWAGTVEDGASGAMVFAATPKSAVVTDSSANVYVAGSISSRGLDGNSLIGVIDLFITKYNSTGLRQWTIEDGASGAHVESMSIAVDASANIYVTGVTDSGLDGQLGSGNGNNMFISKYNSSGTRLWTVEDGGSADVYGYGITVDSASNIYVTGATNGGIDGHALIGNMDFFITKYSSAGTRLWTVEDGVLNASIFANGITVDSSSNVYITGSTTKGLDGNALIGNQDLFITKYNSSGTRQWTIEDGAAAGTVFGYTVSLDSSSNVYVTGSTSKGLDGNSLRGSQDFFITKYNSSGARQWTTEDGVAAGTTTGSNLSVDSSSNVYVTGYTNKGLDGNSLSGTLDLFITKYNSSGTRQWTTEDGVANAFVYSFGLALDPLSNVYVAGSTYKGLDGNSLVGMTDLFITQYSPAGGRE